MPTFTSASALAQHIASQYATSLQMAQWKVQMWAVRIKRDLEAVMQFGMYAPFVPKMYSRTGEIFKHIKVSYSNGTSEAKAEISFTPYGSVSFLNGAGGYDVMQLLEQGYSVKKPVPWRNTPYAGQRPGAHVMQKVVQGVQSAAKADGVDVTLN